MTYIIGIDPSWSSCGIVRGTEEYMETNISVELPKDNLDLTLSIFNDTLNPMVNADNFYIIEDYSRGGAFQNPNSLISMAELRGVLNVFLGIVTKKENCKIIYVAPMQLKKFITGLGKGNKSKIMQQVLKRWNFEAENDDIADAYGLWQIGRYLSKPNFINDIDLIKPQKEVLNKLYEKYENILKI